MELFIHNKRTNQVESLTERLSRSNIIIRFVQTEFDNGFLEPHNLTDFIDKVREAQAGFPDHLTYCKYTEIAGCWKLAEPYQVTSEAELSEFFTDKETDYLVPSWGEHFSLYLVAFNANDVNLRHPIYIGRPYDVAD
ncbi:hypothetical protein [Paenibacillus sp.]|uniref:hypothetical protein n=1 Tax=Paenibacillus sp. TaxID=58172 RepID=UPI003562C8A2